MDRNLDPVGRLTNQFSKLPGIGNKTAQRLAFHIISMPSNEALEISSAIIEVVNEIKFCSVCGNICQGEKCNYCLDDQRSPSIICVVENPRDLMAMEDTREFDGKYHVLNGVISPMDGIGPDDINLKSLFARLSDDRIKEVILATNPDIEGEATASYIARLLKTMGIKATRLAYGLPVGSGIEYTDSVTLSRALEGRQEI